MTYMRNTGNLYYGTSANPASTNANAQVTNFAESTSVQRTEHPGTMAAQPFDIITGQKTEITVEFLDDADATGAGGFFEFLAVQGATNATIYVAWQPTGAATPETEYKCTAARASRRGPGQGLITCTVTMPAILVTDTFPT